jgi:twitching motility two-component system response regulator PilH
MTFEFESGVLAPRPAVLIVEDDADTRELYRLTLLSAGFRVVAVEDGLDALQHLDIDVPDVLVLDLMLPRVGGEDVYLEVRSNPKTNTIPVVIVTGADVRHLEESKYRHFLRKPFRPDALVDAVDRAMRNVGFSSSEG